MSGPNEDTPLPRQDRERPAVGDCIGCRVVGGIFGVAGSGFLASHLLQTPTPMGAHRYGIIGASGAVFMMGMYRAFF
eukprot:gene24236-9835_t